MCTINIPSQIAHYGRVHGCLSFHSPRVRQRSADFGETWRLPYKSNANSENCIKKRGINTLIPFYRLLKNKSIIRSPSHLNSRQCSTCLDSWKVAQTLLILNNILSATWSRGTFVRIWTSEDFAVSFFQFHTCDSRYQVALSIYV